VLDTKDAAWDNGVPGAENIPLLVCTTHIHWDPEFCDVKLAQTMMLMHELRLIADASNPSSMAPPAEKVHLLLCGDLNSLPDSGESIVLFRVSSYYAAYDRPTYLTNFPKLLIGVAEFLQTSRIASNHPDFKDLAYKQPLNRLSFLSGDKEDSDVSEYTHAFKLSSTYNTDVMPYTNYTFEFKGVIDYIFYSRPNMSPLGLLGPLDQGYLQENKIVGAPHASIPSGKEQRPTTNRRQSAWILLNQSEIFNTTHPPFLLFFPLKFRSLSTPCGIGNITSPRVATIESTLIQQPALHLHLYSRRRRRFDHLQVSF